MNIFLWILQIALGLHTLMGAIWKFSNSETNVPPLATLPHKFWLSLGVVEIFSSIALLLPLIKSGVEYLSSFAAIFIIIEMIGFSIMNLNSNLKNNNQMIYWIVVALLSGVLVIGRLFTHTA